MKKIEFFCDQKRRPVSVVTSFDCLADMNVYLLRDFHLADYSVATAHSARPGRLGHRCDHPGVLSRGLVAVLGLVLSGLGAVLGLVFKQASKQASK